MSARLFSLLPSVHAWRGALLLACCALALDVGARTRDAEGIAVPRGLAVTRELGAPPRGTVALRFEELYRHPVGPLGLELSDKVRSLDGQRVRIVGFMVAQSPAPRGGFLFAPIPSAISDDDESLADDLPASSIAVQLPTAPDIAMHPVPGLLQLHGTLDIGTRSEDGSDRNSTIRLLLDRKTTRTLLRLNRRIDALHADAQRAATAPIAAH